MKTISKTRWRWSHCYLILVMCAGALLLAVSSHAQQKIGYVLDVKGDWSLDSNPSQRLSRAAALPAGGVIRLRAAQGVGANYIVVANVAGEVIERRDCRGPENCQAVVLPRAVGRSTSLLSRLYTSVMDRFGRQPEKYRAAISRGSGGEMQEAVILLSARKADFGPAFTKMSAGKYLVRLEPLGNEKQPTLGPFELEWSPAGAQSLIEIKGNGKGLYHLTLLDAKDEQLLGGGLDAWVLICDPDTYPKASSDFREGSAQSASWESKVGKAAIRSFLRAYLEELAERK